MTPNVAPERYVWCAGLAALLLLVALLRRGGRRLGPGAARALARGERGAAHSLAFVLTLPLYVLLVCLVIETALLLVAKGMTVYAAFAAARSGVVWLSTQPAHADRKAHQAAVQALAPVSSPDPADAPGATPSAAARRYPRAYRTTTGTLGPADALVRKYAYAERATRVRLRRLSARPDGDAEAVVTYEAPFHVPLIGRLLGHRSPLSPTAFTYPITSAARLPNEGATSADQKLGIDYVSE